MVRKLNEIVLVNKLGNYMSAKIIDSQQVITASPAQGEAPVNTNAAMVAMLIALLSTVQTLTDLFSKIGSGEANISEGFAKISERDGNQMLAEQAKMAKKAKKQEEHAKKAGIFGKIATGLMLVLSLAGGPAMFAASLALFIATTPGLIPGMHGQSMLDRAATKIAGSDKRLQLLTKVVMIAVIIAATKGAGGTKVAVMAGVQTTVALNPIADSVYLYCRAAGRSEGSSERLSQQIAMGINTAIIIATAFIAVKSATSSLPENSVQLERALLALKTGSSLGVSAFSITSSSYGIETGRVRLTIAGILSTIAEIRGAVSLIQSTQKTGQDRQKNIDNSGVRESAEMATKLAALSTRNSFDAAQALAR
jgi:hypothetical protein